MVDLNARNTDDLDPEFDPDADTNTVHDGVVEEPDSTSNKDIQQTDIIIDETDSVPETLKSNKMDMTAGSPGTLPNVDVDFVVMKDDKTLVYDLKDIEASISGQNGVTQANAVAIESICPGFLGPKLLASEFTVKPSKTNMDKALSFIKRKIALEEMSHVDKTTIYLKSIIDGHQTFVTPFCDEFIPQSEAKMGEVMSRYADVITRILGYSTDRRTMPNVVFPKRDDVINLLTTPISLIREDMAFIETTGINETTRANFFQAVLCILDVLTTSYQCHFINAVITGDDLNISEESLIMDVESCIKNMTFIQFFEFYASEDRMPMFTSLCEMLKNSNTELNNWLALVSGPESCYSAVRDLIDSKKESMDSIQREILYARDVLGMIVSFDSIVESVAEFFKATLEI